MSYLGLHIGSSNRPRFGDYLRLSPGSPIPCVLTLDQNIQAEVKSFSPSTLTLWRTQRNPMGEDNPPSFMDVPLAAQPQLARDWMAGLRPLWEKNPHDALVVNNEQDIGTIDHGQKLNAFFLECMRVAETWGTRIGIASFSTGNPSDDAGLTCEQRWEPMLPAIRQCVDNGHYLILHAHIDQQKQHFADTGFRHERAIRFFEARGIKSYRQWIVLGEWSNGTGGVERNIYDFMDNVRAWDIQAMASPLSYQLVGAALYGFNVSETLSSATDQLLEWISTHPGRVVITPPVTRSNVITVTPEKMVKVYQFNWLKNVTVYAPTGANVKVEVK